MHQPTAEERAQVQVTNCKEEQKITKLKQIIEIKLKERTTEETKAPRRIA